MAEKKKCIPTAVFFLFMAIGICMAEPTPTVSYLMNEPASMLDLGLMRLERLMNEMNLDLSVDNNIPSDMSASYDLDSNKIVIIITYNTYIKHDKNPPKDIKKSVTSMVNNFKLIFASIGPFFKHTGYTIKNEPENLLEEIDKITEIKVVFWGTSIQCISPLKGNEIFWSEK
ncbi:MAG: hypothetical protein V3U02_03765 [Calditrichia bacterium]